MKSKPHKTDKTKPVYIYGKHALREALTQRPESIQKIFLSPQFDDQQLLQTITKSRISVFTLKTKELEDEVGSETSHQGVIALIDPTQLMTPFEVFVQKLDVTKNPGLVIFDEVHDPQNVGSVIRSAAAFGISAVLFPEHNQAQITGAVVKVSAGMAFRIPLVRIGNVNQTIRILKEKGFWVYGLDMNGTPVVEERFEKPSVFILGNEAKGIREKTLELCDIPLSIPMHPRTESLNAATAAAIVMYQWSANHQEALQ